MSTRAAPDPTAATAPDVVEDRWTGKTAGKRAAHATAWLTGAHGALMVAGYVVAVILARDLGPALYGVYGIVYSVLLGAELIGRLGIPQALSRLIAQRRDAAHALEATGVTLALLIYVPLFVVFWVAAPWMGAVLNVEDGARLFRFAAIDIPFFGLYFTVSNILNGRRDFSGESIAIFLYACAKVVGILILAATTVSIEGAFIVNATASIVTLAFLATRVGIRSLTPGLREARTVIGLAFLVGLFTSSAQVLSSLDLWALNAMGGNIADGVKGVYVGAMNLARIANVLAFVMTAVLVPTIAEALSRGDTLLIGRATRGAGRFLTVSLLPMAAIAAGNAGEIMAFVYSEPYRAGAPFLTLLVIGHGVLFTMYIVLASILIGLSFEREAALISLWVVPIAALLNYLMIEEFGAMGAALAAIIALSTAATAVAGRVRRHLGEILTWLTLLRALALGSLAWVASIVIDARGGWLLVELLGVPLACLAFALAIDLVRRSDLELFRPRGRGA